MAKKTKKPAAFPEELTIFKAYDSDADDPDDFCIVGSDGLDQDPDIDDGLAVAVYRRVWQGIARKAKPVFTLETS
jgi:hypothetical protein